MVLIRESMTGSSNPRHLVSGGCHDSDDINEEEENEANPDRERGDQASYERFQALFWGTQKLQAGQLREVTVWPVWMARQVARRSPLSADSPASLAELRQRPLGDSSSGSANHLEQPWATELRVLKRQGEK